MNKHAAQALGCLAATLDDEPRPCCFILVEVEHFPNQVFFRRSQDRAKLAPMCDVLSEEAVREIERLTFAHGACNVRVLDSVRRDEIGRTVFLVDMDEGRSLFDLVALTEDLKEALDVVVDLLTEGSISPYLCDAVLDEARPLSVASRSQNRRKPL